MGSLPGVALPVDVSGLPAKAGSAAPATSAPAPAETAPAETASSADRQQAVIDAQATVNADQAALDEYLASAGEQKPATSLADIDAELDRVAESIASQTAVRPEKDGGVTLQRGENAGRYLTATEYRDALTRCTTLSVAQDGNKPSVGDGVGSTPDQQAPSDEAPALANGDENPSVGQEPGQTPAPSVPSAAPSAPVNGDSTPATPETSAPADGQGAVTARVDITPSDDPTQAITPEAQNASTPTQARADALAATGASSVWVGVGAVAVLVAGAGAIVASRRAKR